MVTFRSVLFFLVCLVIVTVQIFAGQCAATTKKGSQCKRNAQSGSTYCWQHEKMYGGTESQTSSTPKTPEVNKEEKSKTITPKKEYVSTQCAATTKKGTRCKRTAKSGSSYCWQHGG